MAAETWYAKFLTNQITTNQAGDLLYFARSPYGTINDAVISWNDFSAQFIVKTPAGSQSITVGNLTVAAGAIISGLSTGGTAGNLILYSPTASKGNFQFLSADSSGNFSGTLTNTLLSASRTWTLPDSTGTIVLKDTNSNISANSFIEGYATTVTAAATTTLTIASTEQQYFTGSTTQTILLPVTSTLVLGQKYIIVNNSSGVVTVQSSGANTIQAMAANSQLIATCILISGTTAASWSYVYQSLVAGSSPWTSGAGTGSAIGGDGTTVASGNYTIAYGSTTTTAAGLNSFAFGKGAVTLAGATNSVAIGQSATANTKDSIAIGNGASAGTNGSGQTNSIAIGTSSTANNQDCIAIGNSATSKLGAVAIGFACDAFGLNSVAIGYEANTDNPASYSTAIGRLSFCTAVGSCIIKDSTNSLLTNATVDNMLLQFAGGYNFQVGSILALAIDTSSNVRVKNIGSGLAVAEGTNGKQGIATLVGGTVTVTTTSVTANSRIFLTIQSPGGTLGSVYVSARTAGTSFAITSTSAIDTSVVAYEIFEPG